jgi:hypothetical protein
MKRTFLLAATAVLIGLSGRAQGYLDFNNQYAPTHIGSIDGPLAGTGIWAQLLAGATPETLAPAGTPAEHRDIGGVPSGQVFGGTVQVAWLPPYQTAYVEMLAWDGTRWGTLLSGVPKDQLGMTDIVPVYVAGLLGQPPSPPHFTVSAVVPIPEPSVFRIGTAGGLFALLFFGLRKRLSSGSDRPRHRREE